MKSFIFEMTVKVSETIEKLPRGLQNKINAYLDLLQDKGHALLFPYVDKVEGYKNLWELRPHFHNMEFRMIYFWKERTAYFVHAFEERGKKAKNQREYRTADSIKTVILKQLEA
jgi:hypothetical protein